MGKADWVVAAGDTGHPLPTYLSMAIPLAIVEYRQRGGPSDLEIEVAIADWKRLIAAGDGAELLFHEPGKTAQSINVLVRCLAMLAFTPGGIEIFGQHFEA